MEIKLTDKQKEIYERKIQSYNMLKSQLQIIQNEMNEITQVILSANGKDEECEVEYIDGKLIISEVDEDEK